MSYFKKTYTLIVLFLSTACSSTFTPIVTTDTPIPTKESIATLTATPVKALVPNFDHIAIIMFENEEYENIFDGSEMPNYKKLANENTLLTQYYAVGHPSLINYLALVSGDTFGINTNCTDCFIDAESLPDLIEASGRTWKTYQEDMPSPCFIGNNETYVQKHNPFIYFDSIRLDKDRCEKSIVPFHTLQKDIDTGSLPNFIFITPNICNSGHDCDLTVADNWLVEQLDVLIPALDAEGTNYLVVLSFDEGDGNDSCCGMPIDNAGGHIAVIFISPMTKNNFQDSTPYSHYSLLKTISTAWDLPYLGHANDKESTIITMPWK